MGALARRPDDWWVVFIHDEESCGWFETLDETLYIWGWGDEAKRVRMFRMGKVLCFRVRVGLGLEGRGMLD